MSAMRERVFVPWLSYIVVAISIFTLTIILHPFRGLFNLVNIVLLYLLPVLISAIRWGLRPALFAALAGLLAFDWFFVPPFYSFSVSDLRYIISFGVFLIVAILTASLASQLRQQLNNVKQRESMTATLYSLSRQITATADLQTMLETVVQQVSGMVDTEVGIFLPDTQGDLELVAHSNEQSSWCKHPAEMTIAKWVYHHGEMAGRGTATLRESAHLYIPLCTEEQTHGVLGVNLGATYSLDPERFRMIEAISRLAAVTIAKMKLAEEAKMAQLMTESEKLRNAILNSLSHELRTPLAGVIGAVTALLEVGDVFTSEDRNELLKTIREGATRMDRLVTNLLSMVRIESGMLQLRRELCDLEDMIGVALRQVKDSLENRQVRVSFDKETPRISVDDVLVEQVVVNLLSNAMKYSPSETQIEISVRCVGDMVAIAVSDLGIGIPESEIEQIFDKFYRSARTKHIPGTGLGLAICKGIVEAHGGRMLAESNREKGTVFTVLLPISERESH